MEEKKRSTTHIVVRDVLTVLVALLAVSVVWFLTTVLSTPLVVITAIVLAIAFVVFLCFLWEIVVLDD